MRVILQKEVHNLGDAGDVVKTTAGYARNFLVPRGLAVAANEGSVRQVEHVKRLAEAARKRELAGAREAANKLSNAAVSIRREVGEENKLFGSVTNRDIAEALAAEGFEVDKRAIALDEPIRALGVFQVPIRLHKEVTANVKVFVIKA